MADKTLGVLLDANNHNIEQLVAELAEARAQLAAKDAEIERLTAKVVYWRRQFFNAPLKTAPAREET